MGWADILKELLKFFPRLETIPPDEGGLFIRCGRLKKVIGPGVYFCLPYFDEITHYTTSYFTTSKTNQSLTTKDKKTIIVSWWCVYLVHKAELAFLEVDDVDDNLLAVVAARLSEYVGKRDYIDMKPNLITNHIMRVEFVDDIIKTCGLRLVGFFLNDLALHRTFRLIHEKGI